MAKHYKLYYFDMRGLAEMIRLLLVDSNIPFEERRYTKEEYETIWEREKTKYPFQQLPVLLDDDEHISQSGAIMRHLARKHGLYGRTESEHTFCDMFFDGIKDLHSIYARVVYCGDQNHEELKKDYLSGRLPHGLSLLEKLMKTHENGEHFVLGDKISFVDYCLFEELDQHLRLAPKCLQEFPVLSGFHDRMNQRAGLQTHLLKRASSNTPVNWSGNAN